MYTLHEPLLHICDDCSLLVTHSLLADIDSLLLTLKSLAPHEENTDDLRVLESMLKSHNFKRAKKVIVIACSRAAD